MQVSSPAPSSISSQDIDVQKDGKECSNLLVLVSELYNFQVISSVLIFEMIRDLLDGDLTEFSVELLLKLLRSKLTCFFSISS
jgi:nucleolar MIF4G domain-containing protein 1